MIAGDPIAYAWAKLLRDPETCAIVAALPLADHGFDVAAALAALFAGGAWDRALAETAGRALTRQDLERLLALAALHDIGKANRGFHARWRDRARPIGHEGQVAALVHHRKLGVTDAGRALNAIVADWGAEQHLAALMAHHGRPRAEFARQDHPCDPPWYDHINDWSATAAYDPPVDAMRVIAAVRARYPLAFEPGAPLSQGARFVALFAGLMTLADWLGSDATRFPVEGPYGNAREPLRVSEAEAAIAAEGLASLATPEMTFAQAFGGLEPRGVQLAATADDLGRIALIEAETGSGKTEAALWRWLALRRAGEVDGLYFALPTRSAAVQLHARVGRMLEAVWGDRVHAVLAVPGYLRVGEAEGEPLPGWEVRWDDDRADGRWAAERTNRYLAARVAVGTIDQALLGALQVKHAHLRAAALSRSLLVVDEVHASDAYMGALLRRLLDNHNAAGGHTLLLSATLGGTARARLLGQPEPTLAEAEVVPYPAVSGSAASPRAVAAEGRSKVVRIEIVPKIDDAMAIAALAIEAAGAGAPVLVVRNSVRGAVAVAQAVAARAPDLAFKVGDVATLHHGRFAPDDRRLLDCAVEKAFGKTRTADGRILVGTQTLEQSLDIDADLLVTDLAPIDVLLQRIGRLHRHPNRERGAFAQARAIVLTPPGCDLAPFLGSVRDRHGLGPSNKGKGVYPNLLHLEATLRLLRRNPEVVIPADNRRLVEQALHPEVLTELADELGSAWRNHYHDWKSGDFSDRETGRTLSLDLSCRFTDLTFPERSESVSTRLGEQALLVDIAPFAGPFGEQVTRVAIPHWMTSGITPKDEPVLLGRDDEGQRFAIGKRQYVYGRWGLTEDRSGG